MKRLCDLLSEHHSLVMGIVNVTPDSFYDGGKYYDSAEAVQKCEQLIADGADIIDIGGESTRPDAVPVTEDEELKRVIPVISQLSKQADVLISIDTTKARVAREALNVGASIINDISGMRTDPEMIPVAKDSNADIIIMHMQGTPQTMQHNPSYTGWVVDDICSFFSEHITLMVANGIQKKRIVLDPGIGFGKTVTHNFDIIANAGVFRKFGLPVLFGPSNKSFLTQSIGKNPQDKIWGTAAVISYLLSENIDIVRVHNVREMNLIKNVITTIRQEKRDRTLT